jgi:hypothetical protein
VNLGMVVLKDNKSRHRDRPLSRLQESARTTDAGAGEGGVSREMRSILRSNFPHPHVTKQVNIMQGRTSVERWTLRAPIMTA